MPSSVEWYGDEVMARARRGAMQGVVEALGILDGRAVQLIMSGPKSGRIYIRRGVAHQASAPGQPPASDTGTLVNTRRTELHEDELRGALVFSADYAAWLERGTRRMAPRPFARRAVVETKDQIEAAINRNVAAALRG